MARHAHGGHRAVVAHVLKTLLRQSVDEGDLRLFRGGLRRRRPCAIRRCARVDPRAFPADLPVGESVVAA